MANIIYNTIHRHAQHSPVGVFKVFYSLPLVLADRPPAGVDPLEGVDRVPPDVEIAE